MLNKVVEINNLTKIYQLYKKPKDRIKEAFSIGKHKNLHENFYALENVSLEIPVGETYGIIGKNGSGKSTLLKIITGVLTPTSGEVKIKGKISALLELGAGFNMEYSGIENIYLNGDVMGYSKSEIEERIPEIVEFADIGEHIYQPVKTYSSGMFVRLAFALAINVEPEILIVDEALSVGDAFFQLKCYKKFTEFKKKGKTIIFVTHDMSSILKYCDRVLVLNDGIAIEEGNPREMVDLYKKVLVGQEKTEDDQGLLEEEKAQVKSNVELSENILEYGTKQAEIIEIQVNDMEGNPCQRVDKFQKIDIRFKVKFNEAISDPIVAFTLKNIKGTEICGTNNMFEGIDGFKAKKGDVFEASFVQEIALQTGSYFLSLGCTGLDLKGNFTVFHRYYDVLEINVAALKDTVGFYDMNSKVEITKIESERE